MRALTLLLLTLLAATPVRPAAPEASLVVSPREATVGDRLTSTLALALPAGTRFEPTTIGPALGPFSVISQSWEGPEELDGATGYRWNGTLVAFETGELEVPAIQLTVEGEEGRIEISTASVTVQILSVLDGESSGEEAELADIKPPVSVDPDLGPLKIALAAFLLLLLVAAIVWWLQRRYASRFAAVPTPDDPFHRMPPHEWIYRELQLLLERRIAEQGDVDLFYSELSRILKIYLGGRYRVDLMEHTTEEVAPLLARAGAEERAIEEIVSILAGADRVKFAQERPQPSAWRAAVEAVYAAVDRTKPQDAESRPGERGAA